MSVTAPRCHLCHEVKYAVPSGLLLCDHCDRDCPASREKRNCDKCKQADKSDGRGPRS